MSEKYLPVVVGVVVVGDHLSRSMRRRRAIR